MDALAVELPHPAVPLVITGSEVPGAIPLEVTDHLPGELRRLTDHHEPGLMVEQGVELLAMLDWSRASVDNVSVRAKRGRGWCHRPARSRRPARSGLV